VILSQGKKTNLGSLYVKRADFQFSTRKYLYSLYLSFQLVLWSLFFSGRRIGQIKAQLFCSLVLVGICKDHPVLVTGVFIPLS
jgi:hypothetical protein